MARPNELKKGLLGLFCYLNTLRFASFSLFSVTT